jgi:hypothetical protein
MEISLPNECGIVDDEKKNIEDNVLTITKSVSSSSTIRFFLATDEVYSLQMKQFFDPCVNRTLELIDGQIASILRSGKPKPKVCKFITD